MKIAIALGGNALLRRGEPMTAENQRVNIACACEAIARVAKEHTIILSHGNGPQVGLLSLQAEAYSEKVEPYPFDILGAESQGMIGYMLVQALHNILPMSNIVAVITLVAVDKQDPALEDPTKFIGPVYSREQAEQLRQEKGWAIKPDGQFYRRVVPSPRPTAILEITAIRALVDNGAIVIAGGGGGVPIIVENNHQQGIEAVIDKDLCCSLLARELNADRLILVTDVKSVFVDFGKPCAKAIKSANPQALYELNFSAGSMGPKVQATCEFVMQTGNKAMIGALEDIELMVENRAGTLISNEVSGINYY